MRQQGCGGGSCSAALAASLAVGTTAWGQHGVGGGGITAAVAAVAGVVVAAAAAIPHWWLWQLGGSLAAVVVVVAVGALAAAARVAVVTGEAGLPQGGEGRAGSVARPRCLPSTSWPLGCAVLQ
jgi:hypothetical protein